MKQEEPSDFNLGKFLFDSLNCINAIQWRSRIALRLTTNPDFAFICYLCSFIHSFLWTHHMFLEDQSMSGSFLECPLPFHSHELGSWQIFLHTWLLNWVSCRHATCFFETSFYFSKQICKWFLSSWKIMGKSAWLRVMD